MNTNNNTVNLFLCRDRAAVVSEMIKKLSLKFQV